MTYVLEAPALLGCGFMLYALWQWIREAKSETRIQTIPPSARSGKGPEFRQRLRVIREKRMQEGEVNPSKDFR